MNTNSIVEKINIVGKKEERIHDTGPTQRHIEPAEFAAAVGTEPCSERHASDRDPISLRGLRQRTAPGQIASVILRMHLETLKHAAQELESGKRGGRCS